jgi:Protein of unknown function (DUF3152)
MTTNQSSGRGAAAPWSGTTPASGSCRTWGAAARTVAVIVFVLLVGVGVVAGMAGPLTSAGVPRPPEGVDGPTAPLPPLTAPASSVAASADAERRVALTTDPEAPTAADREAGILLRVVAESGTGEFDVATGSAPAPGTGEVHTLRVEVERDLPVDRDRFAGFVLATLNDPRSWGHHRTMTFARTDGDAPITVVLASPDTTARMCGDVSTRGLLSCRIGPHVVLTFHRWVNGTDEYANDLTGYRRYLVNHEVGHALGHGHERCPGPGEPAPVMQQQTLGLKGCGPNAWPYPGRRGDWA